MLNIRVIRNKQFIRADQEGTLNLEASREALCRLLQEGTEGQGKSQGKHDLLFDLRDADIQFEMKDVWTLAMNVQDCDPGFDGRLALLDDWDDTFDRVQFFEASTEHIGIQARAFLDFERAVDWLWDSRDLG